MNTKALDETIYSVAATTIEKLALMFLLSEDEAAETSDAAMMLTKVSFEGPFTGTLFLAVPAQMTGQLAANMLGREDIESISLQHQQDAVKELANVICGNLLPEIAGNEAVFHVCGPELLGEGQIPSAQENQRRLATASLDLHVGKVELAFFVDKRAPVAMEK